MPVIDVVKDPDARTLTINAHFEAPAQRLWDLYADPRQLEKVWGPPEFPATFVEHSLTEGSRSTYFMTGQEGEKYYGYWKILTVDQPTSFTWDDGFADENFAENAQLPVSHNTIDFSPSGDGTEVTIVSVYESAEALQQVLEMGVEEGLVSAMNQIDDVLAQS